MNRELLRKAVDVVRDFVAERSGGGWPDVPKIVSGNEVYDAVQPVRERMPDEVANAWKLLKRLSKERRSRDPYSSQARTLYDARQDFGNKFLAWIDGWLKDEDDGLKKRLAMELTGKPLAMVEHLIRSDDCDAARAVRSAVWPNGTSDGNFEKTITRANSQLLEHGFRIAIRRNRGSLVLDRPDE